MAKVQVYAFVSAHGYYGYGLFPEHAEQAAIKAGMSKKYLKDAAGYSMKRLPEGVVSYEFNGWGGTQYWFAEGVDASTMPKPTELKKVKGAWVEAV